MDLESILRTLRLLRPDLESRFKVKELGLFGSFVRGDQSETSDVDVLVVFAPGASYFDLVRLGQFLEDTLHRNVDIVPQESLRPELRNAILREKVPV